MSNEGTTGSLILSGPGDGLRKRVVKMEQELQELRTAIAAANKMLLEVSSKHSQAVKETARLIRVLNSALERVMDRVDALEDELDKEEKPE